MYMYIHVQDGMYLYVHGINMYEPCSDTYVPCCPIMSRWVGFQSNFQMLSMYWYRTALSEYDFLPQVRTGTYFSPKYVLGTYFPFEYVLGTYQVHTAE
jgi:hypothetical protein